MFMHFILYCLYSWSIESIKNEVEELQKQLILLNSPTVFCHNDLLPKNIIYDKEIGLKTFYINIFI